MPARTPHPIRQIRDALSAIEGRRITQAQFAKDLGVSAALINALETKASRILSEDLRERLAMRYGVGVDLKKRRAFSLALPDVPLAEALTTLQDKQTAVDTGALIAFESTTLPHLRALLLAAHGKKKAAIGLEMLNRRIQQLTVEMGLSAAMEDAHRQITMNEGEFPAELFREKAGESFMEYAAAFVRSKGAKLPPQKWD